MSARELFAGIDGGGSKTLAVVVDAAGTERGRGIAESSNLASVGIDRAVAEIETALDTAFQLAGGALPLAGAWIGLAGVDRPADHAAMLPRLRGLAADVRLSNDADLVLAALPAAIGVAAIAGTGSIMLGRDPTGATTRTGGWGHVIGDEGSGYELGRRALQALSRAADGRGPATALLPAILEYWQLSDPEGVFARVYPDHDKAAIARLSGTVFAVARAGDPVARGLVASAASELALGILTIADRLNFGNGPLPLALAGGLLVSEADLRAMVLRRVRRRRPVGPLAIVAEPAVSAARALVGGLALTPA